MFRSPHQLQRRDCGRQRIGRVIRTRNLPPLTFQPLRLPEDGVLSSRVAACLAFVVTYLHLSNLFGDFPPLLFAHFKRIIIVVRVAAPHLSPSVSPY